MRRSMMRTCLAAVPLLAALSAAAAGGANREWQGRYRYEHDAGLTEGGSPVHVGYDLALWPAGSRGGCLLTVRGFQSDERILCQARGQGETLTIAFHRYEDGRTLNKYGVAVHKPGESLFTLAREGAGLVTRWEGLKPDGAGVPESGVFFAKAK